MPAFKAVFDFSHLAFERFAEVRIDFNFRLVSQVNPNDVAFVHFDIDLHHAEVADVQNNLPRSETVPLHTFADLLGQGGDHTCLGCEQGGATQVVFGFLERRFATPNGVLGASHARCAGEVGVGRGGTPRFGHSAWEMTFVRTGPQRARRPFGGQLVGLALGHWARAEAGGLGRVQRTSARSNAAS